MAKPQPARHRSTKPRAARARFAGWLITAAAIAVAGLGGSAGASPAGILSSPLGRDAIPERRVWLLASEPGFSVSDAAGPPGRPLPLQITLPPLRGEPFRMLMLRGMPEGMRLSVGTRLDDAWAISPEDAGRLALEVPADFSGTFQLEVQLMHGRGDIGERQTISVSIATQHDEQAATTAAPQGIAPEREAAMIERGREMVQLGDIAGARLIFEYLAAKGSASGIHALAQTYDPEFLLQMKVRGGVQPDLARALELYRRAAAAGSEPASTRLGSANLGN